jgi:hypothetical protein
LTPVADSEAATGDVAFAGAGMVGAAVAAVASDVAPSAPAATTATDDPSSARVNLCTHVPSRRHGS